MLQLSLVDDKTFREFVNFLEPEYQVQCCQTFCAHLDGLKMERAKSVQQEMASASSVAITTDIWTSMTNESYISLAASYITLDWQIAEQRGH